MRWQRFVYPGLVVLTVLVYSRTVGYGFVDYDDTTYITENRNVLQGLSRETVAWALTTDYFSNWHPLTWMSYLIDVELFGRNAAGFHLHNILLHTANVLLLFTLFWRTTGMLGPSAFVAALFAVHPLHVESVAWISERKDVLSTLFGLLAIGAYVEYTRRRRWWFVVSLLFYACSLMSKQTLVTLPFVLLLLDYWPLRRIAGVHASKPPAGSIAETGQAALPANGIGKKFDAVAEAAWTRLIAEKLPFVVISIAAAAIVLLVQSQGGSVAALQQHSIPARLSNAVVVYLHYPLKMLWPVGLSAFYPHPGDSISRLAVMAAAVALVAITVTVFVVRRRFPYLLVGWCWYLGTLVPMIGLVQVGQQRMADRYTYFPMIGLYLAITWLVTECAYSIKQLRRPLAVVAVLVLGAAAGRAWHQAGFWRDSATLFTRALTTTRDNHIAHNGLGHALKSRGEIDGAIPHFQRAVAIAPWFVEARTNLGSALYAKGRVAEAIQEYRQSLELNPRDVETLNNLAVAVRDQDRLDEAVELFRQALQVDPEHAAVHTNLGVALYRQQRVDEALFHLREAVRINPDYATGHYNLAVALSDQQQPEEAKRHYDQAIRLQPAQAAPGDRPDGSRRRGPAASDW